MVLQMPAETTACTETSSSWIHFNKDGWTCQQSLMDPCLFILERRQNRTWMLCFVDDIDCASESKEDPQTNL